MNRLLVVLLLSSLLQGCGALEGCVSDSDMNQQKRAQALVFNEIPKDRVLAVRFNDGCDSLDEPTSSMLVGGKGDPLELLLANHHWQRLLQKEVARELALSGARLPFEGTYILVFSWKVSDQDRKESGFPRLGGKLGIERNLME